MSSSSKKSLLAKLKKDIQSKKSVPATSVAVTPDNLHLNIQTSQDATPTTTTTTDPSQAQTVQDRHLDLLRKLSQLLSQRVARQQVQDAVRLHISYFPEDQSFYRLLSLDDVMLQQFTHMCISQPELNVLTSLKLFVSSIASTETQDIFQMLKVRLREEPIDTLTDLMSIDNVIFGDLVIQPKYNDILVAPLLELIGMLPSNTSVLELKRAIEQFLYNHRYDYALSFLQNPETENVVKEAFVYDAIRREFENTRSQRLFLQIMTLIEENVQSFQKPLQSILFRNLPDKEVIPSLKNFLEVILDVIINKVSGKGLEKYFTSNAKLKSFRQKLLPALSSKENYTSLLHNRCIEEFEQSYLFVHAKRVDWRFYLEAIQRQETHPLLSLEFELYEHLRKDPQHKITHIMGFMDQTEVNRPNLNSMLQQFIATRPYSERADLEKLLVVPLPKVKEILLKYQAQEYVQAVRDISALHVDVPSVREMPSQGKKNVEYIDIVKDTSDMIERTRPYLSNFDHVAIRPIDDISIYIRQPDGNSVLFFLPNDLFFSHLVDSGVPKSQQGDVFTLNGSKMYVANVSISNDYMIQDEDTFREGVTYVQRQKRIENISGPIPYFVEFCEMPVLNHQSQFMETLRGRNRTLLSSYLLKESIAHSTVLAEKMECSIYNASSNLGEYTQSLSVVLTLLSSTTSSLSVYTTHFKKVLRTGTLVLEKIGILLGYENEAVLEALFPEALYATKGSEVLRGMFVQDTALCKRRIILDAYTREFPMRRIPYIPVNQSIRYFQTDNIEVDSDRTYVVHENMQEFFREPRQEEAEEEQEDSAQVTTEMEREVQELVEDPLATFLTVALDMLEEL